MPDVGQLRVARDGAVVHGVLAIERDQPAVRRQHQRIDLHQLGVAGRIGRVEPARAGRRVRRGRTAAIGGSARSMALGIEPAADIDRQPQQRVGMRARRSPRCPCRPAPRTAAAGPWMRDRSARPHTSRARSAPAPRPAPWQRDARRCSCRGWRLRRPSPRPATAASLMPPALPRLPVGTCALITHGPSSRAAAAASSGAGGQPALRRIDAGCAQQTAWPHAPRNSCDGRSLARLAGSQPLHRCSRGAARVFQAGDS